MPLRASDAYNQLSSPLLPRPITPSFSTLKKDSHHRITRNLWTEAVAKLPEKDQKAFEQPKSGTATTFLIDDALARVKGSEEKVNRNLFRVKTKRGEVPLRHYVDKLSKVLVQFREIGDILVQYDPGHAALPWAGIAVDDTTSFQDMAEGIELVSAIITRYAVVESLYLLEDSTLQNHLTDGITKLYVAILKYLGNHEGMTPLHNLARSGLASHVRIILEAGSNPIARDKHNRQPIQYAAKTNEATVRALLDFKADVNVTGSDWPSPIVYASSEANLQVLRLLLDGGADARSEDPESPGWTALHAACKRVDPDPAFAELLIANGADVNIATTVSKTTPLHNAVNSAAVVQLLLKMGARVDARDSENKTPLMCACETVASAQVVEILIDADADPMIKDKTIGATGLHYSCFSDDFAPVVIASSKCFDIDVRDKFESTPLMWASWNGHPGAVKELLKAGSVDTCVTKAGGINAFLYAVMDGHIEVVKLLLEHNPGIIAVADKQKNTALHFACREGRLDILKLLLDTDASNISAVNSRSYTAFDEAAKGGHTDIVAFMLARDDVDPHHRSVRDSTPLLLAVYTGKKDLIEMLMNVEGADLAHGSTGGMTLFKMAAFMGLASICRTLIEKGVADCTIPSKTGGFYPLHFAVDSDDVEVIELLLSQPGVDKNAVSTNGYTPLCDAVRKGYLKSVETLLAHDVEVDTPDNRGRTPLLIAAQRRDQDIVKALIGAGAKAGLNEALSIVLTNRDEEIVQLLKNAGAIEKDEGFGIEELMKMATLGDVFGIEAPEPDTGDTATAKEPQAISGAECVEEDLTS
ncbi:ankyrin [Aureobasidium pullulans]|nr:ankyrin [Aureobasidium pullulans]